MFDDLIQEFLGSGSATKATEALSQQQGLPPDQARNAVRATAEGGLEALGQGGFDLGSVLGALGGLGGLGGLAGSLGLGGERASPSASGLPAGLDRHVAEYVAAKTGLSVAVASAVVAIVLPKVIEFAKGIMADRATSPPP